ncbi:hypothetical protein [Halorubrum trueperi]|uniref:Uncharacterized protein n=1 Tax=Halorubrum trueperi TaxID=2004704 RepID=A0ABD5UG77_9EURY
MTSNDDEDRLLKDGAISVEKIARGHRDAVNIDEVERILESEDPLQMESYNDLSPEERTAYLAKFSEYISEGDLSVPVALSSAEGVIRSGVQYIKENEDYWRFEPTIECIFEMDHDELEVAMEYFEKFHDSDYDIAQQQYMNSIHDAISDISSIRREQQKRVFDEIVTEGKDIPDEVPGEDYVIAEVASHYLELYREIAEFSELAFPQLLMLKRILDGEEEVDPAVLQSKNASSVRRELTDEDTNAVYFDLIVEKYNSDLRNALAHGDYLVDSQNSVVQITSANTEFSFEEIEDIVHRNISNFVFLSGAMQSLVEWRYITFKSDKVGRDLLPI